MLSYINHLCAVSIFFPRGAYSCLRRFRSLSLFHFALFAARRVSSMAILRTIGLWFFSVAPWCLSGVPATATAKQIFRPPTSLQALSPEHCPASCSDIFPRLKCNGDCSGGMEHYVEVQERGGEHLERLEPHLLPIFYRF